MLMAPPCFGDDPVDDRVVMRCRHVASLASALACAVSMSSCALPVASPPGAAPVQVVAHRGASLACPENTLAAFRRAVQGGADVVEFDVYQTRDGHWVCMHDATCDRTSDARELFGRANVRVDQLTLADVQRLDAGRWFAPQFAGERVPTLEQALAAIAPATPMIERKAGDALQLVAELQRLDRVEDVIVQSFDWSWLAQVSSAEPRLLLAALAGGQPTPERLIALEETGAKIVHWRYDRVTRAMADAVHASGRRLCVYTVDLDMAFYGAVAIGCDLVTTNRPVYYVAERAKGRFVSPQR